MSEFDGQSVQQRTWSVVAISLALVMAVLDGAIANVALPTITRELAATPDQAIWVVNGYQLAVLACLLPLAALGEMIGYRRVFLAGVVVFTAASIACALANSLAVLIVTRVLQGLGAAGIMSVNGALLRFTYPSQSLGRGVGLNTLAVSAAAAFGPTVASGILALGPWEWLFAVNIPIGILAILVGRSSLPESPTSGKLDLASTLLNIATFGLGFTSIDALTSGGDARLGGAEAALAALAGLTLILRSRKQASPLVPIDLLRNKMFSLSAVTSIASFAAQTLALISLPFYLQGVLHRSQVDTGFLMTPWPVAAGFAVIIAGRLADRFAAAFLSGAGLALLALGLLSLALLPTDATSFSVAWRMAICGLGFGFFQAPNNRTMLSSAPIGRSGAAGGMLATARLSGQTIGASLAAISFRLVSHAVPIALGVAALFAAGAAAASVWRLRYAAPASPREPPFAADTAGQQEAPASPELRSMNRLGLNIPVQFWANSANLKTCSFSAGPTIARITSWTAIIAAVALELFAIHSLGVNQLPLYFAALTAPVVALLFLPQIRRYRLLKKAVANMWQGLTLYNDDGQLVLYNTQFCTMLGLSPTEVRHAKTHRDITELSVQAGNYGGLSVEQVWSQDVAFITRRQAALTYIDLPNKRTVAQSHQPIAGGGWIRTYADVTGRREVEARIIHMARHDALTDLPNRVLFRERLENALESVSERVSVALMFLDLDRFKAVNDTMGHAVGDRLLKLVADRLRGEVRATDTAARLGGDEFAIVLVGIEYASQACTIAERLVASISEPYDIDGLCVSVGVSLGVTFAPADGMGADKLLRNADIALYQAKSVTGGVYRCFTADMEALDAVTSRCGASRLPG